MKWYGILAFFVLIGGLGGIVLYGMNTEKAETFVGANHLSQNTSYNCEINLLEFSEMLILLGEPVESNSTSSPVQKAIYEKEAELIKNNCIFTDNP